LINNGKIDFSYLSFDFHQVIVSAALTLMSVRSQQIAVVSPQLSAPASSSSPLPHRCLVIGLGGGALTMFLNQYVPSMSVTAVELDSDVFTLAVKHFNFPAISLKAGSKLHVVIDDGLKWMERTAATENGRSFFGTALLESIYRIYM
jgi:spermidine synthase